MKRTKSGVNTSSNTKYYELIPVINRTDSFRPWQEDHLNEQIRIWVSRPNSEDFPLTWMINEQVKIVFFYYQLQDNDF